MAGALTRWKEKPRRSDRRGRLEAWFWGRPITTSGSALGRNGRASNDGDGDTTDDDTKGDDANGDDTNGDDANRPALYCFGRRQPRCSEAQSARLARSPKQPSSAVLRPPSQT